jgi:D-serine deaminase-like pyridoxal phosphate-dependent protein
MSAGNLGPNEVLIGRVGSRARLNTPALILDLDAFERNMVVMSARVKRLGLNLRPHAKAHKSGTVGRKQVEAGAVGISCATLDEAEAMVSGGVRGILATSPVVDPAAIDRLIGLCAKADEVMTVVDHPTNADALAQRARETGARLGALVDIDVGQHRTGVTSAEAAIDLARRVKASGSIQYRGVQAYYGHLQHVHAYADRCRAVEQALDTLRAAIKALSEAGLAPEIVSGSGTGTHLIDAHAKVHTELQPGSYLFMDRQYNGVEIAPNNAPPFEQALFVRATVVSINQPGLAVVHGGWKAFATESDVPLVHRGAPPDAKYQFMGDEHGGLRLPAGSPEIRLGQVIEFIPPHCDPTVNLFNRFHCVRGDDLVDIWPIEARGY